MFDGQGKANETSISFTVGGEDARLAEVELVLQQDLSTFRQSQLR